MKITISNTQKNMTFAVVSALQQLKEAGGGELHFERGEYHFYKSGCEKRFLAVSNNSACDKYIAFPVIDAKNITVDGHGSNFVFHEVVFPFVVSGSKNVVLKNMILDTGKSPLVEFNLHGFSDDGFYMDIDREAYPFYVEDGRLNFKRESGVWYGREHMLAFHAIGIHKVQYLTTGSYDIDPLTLPAPLMRCDVTETSTGIYAKYRADSPAKCIFSEETVTSIIDGGRKVDVICIDRSSDITVKNITVARGIGMGVIGQLSRNILIDGFSTDNTYHKNNRKTLTADALHFVNCDGRLEIKNCNISDIMDDASNVHGMYTEIIGIESNALMVRIKHYEQYFFNPYRKGDRLVLINSETLDEIAQFIVESADFDKNSGTDILIAGKFSYGNKDAKVGFLVENPDRMPDLYMHHNCFKNFPHNRISGAGHIIIENNNFENCHSALLCLDLAKFWYESGRIKDLVFRNNTLVNCNKTSSSAFVKIGVSGFSGESVPRIHRRIEITGNKFKKISGTAIKAEGVNEIILTDNEFESSRNDIIEII